MSGWLDIPPTPGVPDEFVRMVNDRGRRVAGPASTTTAPAAVTSARGTIYGPDQRPGLTRGDVDFRFFATDFGREYRWTGTAWENADASDPQGRMAFFRVDPGTGWHRCDGTAGVRSSKPDGSTELIDLPDAAGAYLEDGAYTGIPVVAVGPTMVVTQNKFTLNAAGANALTSAGALTDGKPLHLVAPLYMRL